MRCVKKSFFKKTEFLIALMRVFPKAIVLTTKPRIDAYVFFTSKRDLVVRTIALGEIRISDINLFPWT